MDPILIAVIVFFIAVLFSMLGLGGALVYVPLFYWLGIDVLIAIPTALLLNALTASSAAVTYLRKKMVDIPTAAPFIISSTIGAPIGAYFTQSVPEDTLLWIFSIVLVLAGARMLFSKDLTPDKTFSAQSMDIKKRTTIGVGVGFIAGMVAGLLGVGGGIFIVPLLLLLGFDAKHASATSAFIVIFSSVSGFLGHLGTGHMDATLMAYTGIAALLGGQVGAHLMHSKVKSKTIKQMFGIVLWVMAIKIVTGLL